MKILFISSSSLNDIITVNIIYTNLMRLYKKEEVTIDLIFTEKLTHSNIFFSKNILEENYVFSISKEFLNAVTTCKKKEHNYIIKIGTNFKSELIYICFKSQKKVRISFKLANIFKSEKRYIEEYVASKCRAIFNKLKEFEGSQALHPEIILDKNVYAKTHEMVNWLLKSSNRFPLTNHRFCLLYFKSVKKTNNEQLFDLITALLEKNIFIIPIFYNSEVPLENYSKKISSNKQNLLIRNFTQNNDNNHLYLFLKHSKFVITNDPCLKVACDQTQKKILFYDFEDKKQVSKMDFLLDLKFI
jgi:ADP-heptose:LPS heptosyltransferase|tara:strand:- start:362 stop:1264 length:903 start_codon:yes stop_codon:yes gene_type:complete